MEQSNKWEEIAWRLDALAVFRGVLADDVPAVFCRLVKAMAAFEGDEPAGRPFLADVYGRFVAALYDVGGDFGKHLLRLVLESENAVVKLRAKGETEPLVMAKALKDELALFGELSRLVPQELASFVGAGQPLPLFMNTACDFDAVYTERLRDAATKGYGVFATHHMFTLGQGENLLPVNNPDPQCLSELCGYERERSQVLLNTRALLKGLPANNILLYGDAGTGKSSTVKALANEFCGEGLRLVEVRKNQLYQIPGLMGALADNPLKFILFIDDLSFPSDDEEFTDLKAILEGNVSARPKNIVVYATSNRRHLMKERFADRMGEDVHRGDTLEEQTSLAARFGLTITFLKPDRELYAAIVKSLAAEYGLAVDAEELVKRAEAHAIRYGGRSPRTARQFVELVKAEEEV